MKQLVFEFGEKTNEELLATLLSSKKHAAKISGMRIKNLISATRIELGLSEAAYCRLMAGIELGRRVEESRFDYMKPQLLNSSNAVVEFCRIHFARMIFDAVQEQFHIITLNKRMKVIDTHLITVGTLDASLVHPREVFRPAIKDSAGAIVLAHNHPSGDPTPSREDLQVTERLEKCGETIGISVVDHVVLGRDGCTSIREHRQR